MVPVGTLAVSLYLEVEDFPKWKLVSEVYTPNFKMPM